jgi:uracil-DNA glycosylase
MPDSIIEGLQGARLVSLAVWLAGVRRVEVTPDGALVGSPRRLLIVGQAPPRGGNLLPAFSGRSGARLRRLLGLGDEAAFREQVDAFNTLPRYPGKSASGKGDAFDMPLARHVASHIDIAAAPLAIFCGWNAAEAFGFPPKVGFMSFVPHRGTLCAAVPHPSGASRFWNDPEQAAKASSFFAGLVARAAGGKDGTIKLGELCAGEQRRGGLSTVERERPR